MTEQEYERINSALNHIISQLIELAGLLDDNSDEQESV